MKYCENCGLKINNEETNFCSSCGKPCKKTSVLPVLDEKLNQNTSKINEQKESKNYEVIDKIKSSSWNAFLLTEEEIEEYISDGVYFLDKGLLSRFSKENREKEAIRNKRYVDLISQRVVVLDKEYIKYHQEKIRKNIVTYIINSIKSKPLFGVFGQNLSSIFEKSIDDNDKDFQELISKEKKISGNIMKLYPIDIYRSNSKNKGVLFITTKGIAFVSAINESDANVGSLAGYQTLGVLGAVGMKIIADKLHNQTVNKEQQKIIDTVNKYSPSLVAKCINESRFIPYDKINALVYYSKEEEKTESKIYFIYDYEKRVDIIISKEMKTDLIKNLSERN